MEDNDHNFDNEIINYLKPKGYIRRRQLVKDFMEVHKNERGYSLKSINRKLDEIIKKGTVRRVKYPDFEKLGIGDTDKRAIFLTLTNISEIKEHMDNVIENLGSEDPIEQIMALKEIVRYEQTYVLTPKQLDLLVTQFGRTIDREHLDNDLTDKLLLFLYEYILKKGIKPTDREKTTGLLKRLLDKYSIPISTHVNLRTYIIHLLGYYDDELVIERLMGDARTLEDLFSVENDYNTEFIARLIEEQRGKLYTLELELAKERNENASKFVSRIRTSALINLGLHKGYLKEGDS